MKFNFHFSQKLFYTMSNPNTSVKVEVKVLNFTSGWPSSEVTWWRDGAVIDDTWEEISPGKSRNTMKLEHLSRSDLNTELECQGSNNNNTQPVITSLYILMNCELD